MFDKDLPDSIRNGPAADHDDQRPVPVPGRAVEVQVRPARPVGHLGQRALALDGPARRPDRAGEDGLDRGDQPRPGGDLYLHGQPASGPSQPGLLAQLRPGHDEPEPAGLRGDDRVVVEHEARPGDLQPALGSRLSAHQASGRGAAARRATRCSSCRTRTGSTPPPAAARSTPSTGLNHHELEQVADPETQARIAQYEMAFRMQTSVPELADISSEPQHILDMYGPDVHTPGTFARCCLWPAGWPSATCGSSRSSIAAGTSTATWPATCRASARTSTRRAYALVTDLKQRGLLDDTLVIWGGEFGRTIYCQGKLTRDNYGRDHHPKCFPVWMAGAGIKPGVVYGETDDFSYNIVARPGPHPRLERHDPPLPGHRPPPLELQVPGPGRAPDGRRGAPSGQGDLGVKSAQDVLRAVAKLATNAACSGIAQPRSRTARSRCVSPARSAAGSSHKPGKTSERYIPSAPSERSVKRPARSTNQNTSSGSRATTMYSSTPTRS